MKNFLKRQQRAIGIAVIGFLVSYGLFVGKPVPDKKPKAAPVIPITKTFLANPSSLTLTVKTQGTIDFWSTSFIRGTTFDKAIIIVDEFQNLNYHELDSIMTRVGEETKIMFCGDATQTDLIKQNERNGIHDFMRVLRLMSSVDIVEFGVEDIVRSGLVKEYILAKMELNL